MESRYVVVDGNGDLLCISSEEGKMKLVSKPLSEISLDSLFMFWSTDIEELKAYSLSLGEYITDKQNPFSEIDIDSCSFMEITINPEDKTFSLG